MIKVASYNIHKGIGLDRRRNPERVVEVLREINADVIALQEIQDADGAGTGTDTSGAATAQAIIAARAPARRFG